MRFLYRAGFYAKPFPGPEFRGARADVDSRECEPGISRGGEKPSRVAPHLETPADATRVIEKPPDLRAIGKALIREQRLVDAYPGIPFRIKSAYRFRFLSRTAINVGAEVTRHQPERWLLRKYDTIDEGIRGHGMANSPRVEKPHPFHFPLDSRAVRDLRRLRAPANWAFG